MCHKAVGGLKIRGGGGGINVGGINCSPVEIGLTDRPKLGGGGHVTPDSDRSGYVHATAYTPQ